MKKNIGNMIIIVLFVVMIFGMSLGTIIAKDRKFSEVENRNLSSVPEFSVKSLIDGTYGSELETYSSDQLIFKDQMVMFKNQILKATGRTRINNVYLADENMYIQEYTKNADLLKKNIQYIKDWCDNSPLDSANIYMLLAPNASDVYENKLPSFNMNENEEADMKDVETALKESLTFVNPYNILSSHKAEDIYYKTDHHWTMLGAYYGYTELAHAMGNEPVSLDNMKMIHVKKPFYGSLYSQAPLISARPDDMTIYDYEDISYTLEKVNYSTGDVMEEYDSYIIDEKLDSKDKYAALFGGNFAYLKITNNKPDKEAKGKTLLVFKDSYANSIVPYLISDYEMIDIIDLRYFDYMTNSLTKLAKEGLYDDVLFMYNMSFLDTDKNFMGLSN